LKKKTHAEENYGKLTKEDILKIITSYLGKYAVESIVVNPQELRIVYYDEEKKFNPTKRGKP